MVSALTVLSVEAPEACGRGFKATTLGQKHELGKELRGLDTGLAYTKQKFGHVENFRHTYRPVGFCRVKWQLGKI